MKSSLHHGNLPSKINATSSHKAKVLNYFGKCIKETSKTLLYSGEITFLVPVKFKAKLSQLQYNSYLSNLEKNNQALLYDLTEQANKESTIVEKKSKTSRSYCSSQAFLNELNIKFKNKNEPTETIKDYYIFNYKIHKKLKPGESFILIKDTYSLSTIIVEPSSYYETFFNEDFENLENAINIKDRKDNLHFLMNHTLFSPITHDKFARLYFHLFDYRTCEKGDIIVNEREKSEVIVIIKTGVFELCFEKDIFGIQKVIDYITGTEKEIEDTNNFFQNYPKKNYILSKLSSGDTMGMFFYNFNNSSLFSLKAVPNGTKFEFFLISEQNFRFIVEKENLFQNVNDYYNKKRLIIGKQLITLRKSLLNLRTLRCQVKEEKKKKASTQPNIMRMRNTFVETSIFPLEKTLKLKKKRKPLFKFVQGLKKYVNKSKKSHSNSRINKIYNVSMLKSKFFGLSKLDSERKEPKRSINSDINLGTIEGTENTKDEPKKCISLSTNRIREKEIILKVIKEKTHKNNQSLNSSSSSNASSSRISGVLMSEPGKINSRNSFRKLQAQRYTASFGQITLESSYQKESVYKNEIKNSPYKEYTANSAAKMSIKPFIRLNLLNIENRKGRVFFLPNESYRKSCVIQHSIKFPKIKSDFYSIS